MDREIALCIKDGKVIDKSIGDKYTVNVPQEWEKCDIIIHTHPTNPNLSQKDINVSNKLNVPVCALICKEESKICNVQCYFPRKIMLELAEVDGVDWAKVYTFERIIGHLGALEEHFLSYPCWNDCIPKHIFVLKIYLDEAEQFGINYNLMEEIKDYLNYILYGSDTASDADLAHELRHYRKLVWEEFKKYVIGIVPKERIEEFEEMFREYECITKDEWKWEEKKPKTKWERQEVLEKCGSKCFLEPKELKFPICNKSCCLDCDGLRSAYVRARALITASLRANRRDLAEKYRRIAEEAKRLAEKHGCLWVEETI